MKALTWEELKVVVEQLSEEELKEPVFIDLDSFDMPVVAHDTYFTDAHKLVVRSWS
jgi:hypothetical protein